MKKTDWVYNDIDRFVLAKLESERIEPVEDALPRTLVRRLSFDLTGLPPMPRDVRVVRAAGGIPQATGRQFWLRSSIVCFNRRNSASAGGCHWLDVARYAESSGKDINVVYTNAWRYRDYVIQSMNSDLPFDEFLREQIAGDLLPAANSEERARKTIATGFLAVGPRSLNEMRPRQFAVDQADEQIDTTTQAFLGLTVSCARCHDHKFDPILQSDYTAMAGIFLSTDTKFGTAGGVQGRNESQLIELPKDAREPVAAAPLLSDERIRMESRLAELQTQEREFIAARQAGGRKPPGVAAQANFGRIVTMAKHLETELAAHNKDGSTKALAMGVADHSRAAPVPLNRRGFAVRPNRQGAKRFISGFEQIGDSPLFTRGNIDTPSGRVPRGVPEIVAPHARRVPATESGRLELADALATGDHPLTARVIVNRVWAWMFGRGLVESVDNFGTTGAEPSHPELLDYLADRFVKEHWSIKRLVRDIALSHAYQLASTYQAADFTADPDNKWLWRHSPRRLEAEEIRDALLMASGQLNLVAPKASLIGRGGDGPIGGGPRILPLGEQQIAQADGNFRSIYLPLTRTIQPLLLAEFDMPDGSAVQGMRESTNVPAQALFMLNSDFVARQSQSVAFRVLRENPGTKAISRFNDRLATAYRVTLGRAPRGNESAAARKLVERHANNPEKAWATVAQGLLASAEFRIVD